jgi:hypothetical protein
MIEKFAGVRGQGLSEFIDLNHTRKPMILVFLLIPKFARTPAARSLPAGSDSGWAALEYLGLLEFFIVIAFVLGWAILELVALRLDRKRKLQRKRDGDGDADVD